MPNFDCSRWFLVLGVRRPANDDLNRLLLAANQAAKKFGYPELYSGSKNRDQQGEGVDMTGDWAYASVKARKKEEASTKGLVSGIDDRSNAFHVSLAWSLEPPPGELRDLIAVDEVSEPMLQEIAQMSVKLEVVKIKVGNAIHSIDIAPKRKEEKGILGLG